MVEELDTCLEEILTGRKSLEECLIEHADVSPDLKPLLDVALVVARLAHEEPSAAAMARSKARLQGRLLEKRAKRRNVLIDLQSAVLRAAAVAIVVIVAGGGTIVLAASSLPNDALYPLKLSLEQGELAFARGSVQQAEMHVTLAERRLEEIKILQSNGFAVRNAAVLESLSRETEMGSNLAEDLSGQTRTRVLEKLVVLTERQQSVLQGLLEGSPSEARDELTRAVEVSRRGHESALAALGEEVEDSRGDSEEESSEPARGRTIPSTATPGSGKPDQSGRGKEQRQEELEDTNEAGRNGDDESDRGGQRRDGVAGGQGRGNGENGERDEEMQRNRDQDGARGNERNQGINPGRPAEEDSGGREQRPDRGGNRPSDGKSQRVEEQEGERPQPDGNEVPRPAATVQPKRDVEDAGRSKRSAQPGDTNGPPQHPDNSDDLNWKPRQ